MLPLLGSVLVSLLPQRWRRGWGAAYELELAHGALLSGLLELAACLASLIVRYLFLLDARMRAVASTMLARGVEGAMGDTYFQFGAGMFTLMEYLIHPFTLVLIYFTLEGLVRFSAALISGEVVGTLPLHLVAVAGERLAKVAAERALGPRLPDVVEIGDPRQFQLRILSCRPKPWDHLMTVSYEGGLYEVAARLEGPPPRRFIYLLRMKPEHKIVRGLHHYDPNDVLQK